jgi:RNA 2',3'-cyclic 3'-phosphodiesterase
MALPEMLRLFIAIPLPDDVKDAIELAQRELRSTLARAKVRWTSREQFHVTLRFLGGVPSSELDGLTKAIGDAGRQFAPIELYAWGIGFFPRARAPRVIWVGLSDNLDQLPALQRAVEQAVAPFTDEAPEERFAGHVTVGRIKEIQHSEIGGLTNATSAMADRVFGQWKAGEIVLIRSILSSEGAQHTPVAAAPLGRSGGAAE